MDEEILSSLIPRNYVKQSLEHGKHYESILNQLLTQKRIPEVGWSEAEVEQFVHDLSRLDSNNFHSKCGAGEREGRIFSPIVSRRHFSLAHGIGRSGDIYAVQPKATGSSLLNKLTQSLTLHYINHVGISSVKGLCLIPVATGLALTFALLALKKVRPSSAKYVLWSRIDQKACFKSILCAGDLQPIVIDTVFDTTNHSLSTDLDRIRSEIERLGSDFILCMMSTSSCFAPRNPDDLESIASILHSHSIPHLVNNAYGLQSSKACHMLNKIGHDPKLHTPHDMFVQSLDKNFGVPVGGSVICTFDEKWAQNLAKLYPGRASVSPCLDLCITFLNLGLSTFDRLLAERKENFERLKVKLQDLANKHEEELLFAKSNQISIAFSLSNVSRLLQMSSKITHQKSLDSNLSEIGSMLFTRGVTGARVQTGLTSKCIDRKYSFESWGSHCEEMRHFPYISTAISIGMKSDEVDTFVTKLDKVLNDFKRDLCVSCK